MGIMVGGQSPFGLRIGNLKTIKKEDQRHRQYLEDKKRRQVKRSRARVSNQRTRDQFEDILSKVNFVGGIDSKHRNEVEHLLYHLPENQLEEAFALFEELDENLRSHRIFLPLFYRMAEVDPQRALEKMTLTARKRDALRLIMTAWTKRDLDGALSHLEQVEDFGLRRAMMFGVRGGLAPQDLEKWIGYIEKDQRLYEDNIWGVYSKLVEKDPQVAMERAFKESNQHLQDRAVELSIGAWTRKHGSEVVVAWLDTVEEEKVRKMVLPTLAIVFAGEDPEKAMNYLATLSDEERRLALGDGSIGRSLMHAGMEKTVTWANRYVEDKKAQQNLIRHAFEHGVYYRHPTEIVKWMGAIEDETLRQEVISTMLPRWLKADTEAAFAWANTLEQIDQRKAAYEVLASDRAQWEDRKGLKQLIKEEREIEIRDGMRQSVVETLSQKPLQQLEWAEAIENREKRTETVKNIVQNWLNQDREEALHYLQNISFLSEEIKKELLKN